MRRWIGLLLLLLAGSATAREPQSATGCTYAKARDVTIEAIQTDYAAWRGACVRVRGIAWKATLLADREALLEPRSSYGETLKRSLHLYRMRRGAAKRPVHVEVIGSVGSCRDQHEAIESMRAEDPDAIIMLSGYCHTSLETYVHPVSIRVVSRAPVPRLREAEVLPARRGLVTAPTDLPRYAEQVEAARAMIAAVAQGDLKRFVELDSVEIAAKGEDGVAERNAESRARFAAFSRSRAMFAAWHRGGDAGLRVLVERSELERRAESPANVPALLACWCKTGDCDGRWPVLRQDADNAPERPQICVMTNEYTVFGGTPVIQAELETTRGGFAEPSWR